MDFLVPTEMCTIVTVSAQQSLWCCGEVAPQLAHLVLKLRRWYNLRTKISSTGILYQRGDPYW